MKKIVGVIVAMILIAGFSACENENTDETLGQLNFKAVNYTGFSLKSATVEGFVFDSAHIVLEKIEVKMLEPDGDTLEMENDSLEIEDEYEFKYYGPFLIDLLSGTSDPELPATEVEPGIYTKVEAEMAYFEEIGYSFYFSGYFTDTSGAEQWVEFSYAQSEDFKVENPDGFEITAVQINNVWVMVDLGRLLEGLDLSEATVDEDGVIRLNKDSNRDLADIIESNLEDASELGLDEDLDGEIDD
ncbi:MAG: hypothetical protein WD578_04220 [Bacteroidales bacterium]